MKDLLLAIQKTAENLALYDPLTHAFNMRGSEWLVPNEQIKGLGKIDIYDLRQANKVYGVPVVDSELHKLVYQLMSVFTLDKGDFVCRSPGSDEFRIFSTSKTPQEIRLLLTKLYLDQETDSLLTWDFGTGRTETQAENNLQKQRKLFRPVVIRQTILESHSEIPRRIEENNSYQSWNEFNMPYQRLTATICSLELPVTLAQQTIEQIQAVKNTVEDIVTREALTGALDALGAKWYLENAVIQSVALTDMLDMHEGNARYGSVAIDEDLKRFSNMLLEHFSRKEGFLVVRSERAGDEFKIISTQINATQLEARILTAWQNDLHQGLLTWNYGVGRNDFEAHVNLYRNRVKDIENMEVSVSNGKATFIIVRPESEDYSSLFKLSEETARVMDGTPIMDLHLTIQAIRNVEDFEALRKRLEEYCLKLEPFEIKVKHIARMNINNQQGRLWLLAEKTLALEKIHNDIGQIACELGYESYPYKSQDWLPHLKIVNLPENTSTQIKDPTFGASSGITFTVRHFEWTVQKAPERWELLEQFPFPQ
ncbi:MAG TPA: GGDEF domain-containing protein [Anaerolineales bacterium]|nr:GGDEF domain-containing protein [Anaerolineales bacterium]HLO30498.1 GGDEF domain-containing protein [Anaerolineales bacterium]